MARTRNPMARDLRTPKYKLRVVEPKNKKLPRKTKHRKKLDDGKD